MSSLIKSSFKVLIAGLSFIGYCPMVVSHPLPTLSHSSVQPGSLGALSAGWRWTQVSDRLRSPADSCLGGGDSGFTCRPRGLSALITTVFSLVIDSHHMSCWLETGKNIKEMYIFNVSSQEDIRDYSSLYKLCEGIDCIFHTASYGMSGPEQVT